MKTTRAKFKVFQITHNEQNSSLELLPVINGSEENEKFFEATPGGSLVLNVVNTDVAKTFKPGQEFYVDLIPVS